jgi:N,N'-diacetyllegionaminate synthase
MVAKKVRIGEKMIGEGEPCFISLEPSATYETAEQARDIIREAAEAGADAIKFQTFLPGDAERMFGVGKDASVEFGTQQGIKQESVQEAFQRRELPQDAWESLVQAAHDQKISFITTVNFLDQIDFLCEAGVDAFKIAKGDVNNVLLVEAVAKTHKPLIVDGREKFEDVARDVSIAEQAGNNQIIIMHCPSGYPSPNESVHLKALPVIKEFFGYPVGFSDHSTGMAMNFAAVALGATMLEKTVSQNKHTEHVEHYMSLEPGEFREFVRLVRSVESGLGSAAILFQDRVGTGARRCFVAKRDIRAGERIRLDALDFQRPGEGGIPVSEGYAVLEKKAIELIVRGTRLQWKQLS